MRRSQSGGAALPAVSADDRIEAFWDKLAEFGPARTDKALAYAMKSLCRILGAQQAYWFDAVRLAIEPNPVSGWRVLRVQRLHPDPERDRATREMTRNIDKGQLDPSMVANLRGVGRFRISTQCEIVPPGWFEGNFYRTYFEPFGIRDVLYMAMPLHADMEIWMAFDRVGDNQAPFGDTERALLAQAMRPLKWFHRNVALHSGLLVAEKPLAPAERRILAALLSGGSEAEIAAETGLTQATVHTYATRIYRKFNVNGRAALAAIWLG